MWHVIVIWRSRLLPHVPGHSARWGNFRGWFMFSELHIDSVMSNMSFCLCRDLAFVPASGKKGKGQRWFEDSVRASPSGVPHPSSTPQPAWVPLDRTGTSAEWGSPPVSFGASPDSIGGWALSGDDDSAALPPSGVVALSEPDLEMTAMLSRPPHKKVKYSTASQLFEAGRVVSRWRSCWFSSPPSGAILPEVYEELTRSWKAPFTARNKSWSSSPLTTLDGGAALGYTGIPSVERSVAMQLRPNSRYHSARWSVSPLTGLFVIVRSNWQCL